MSVDMEYLLLRISVSDCIIVPKTSFITQLFRNVGLQKSSKKKAVTFKRSRTSQKVFSKKQAAFAKLTLSKYS